MLTSTIYRRIQKHFSSLITIKVNLDKLKYETGIDTSIVKDVVDYLREVIEELEKNRKNK